ncbi:TonB-dependent receptor [Parapedobacter sp. ISTM3]|nr:MULTISPECIES: TonB-dependent receptor [Parapedobacter]MBK1440629.1 TonB-dependent receptor [Parapedobacter sp. ISTM3]
MKLSCILLLISCLQVSAFTYAQRITLQKNQVTLIEVFKDIKRQTGYHIFYDAHIIRNTKPVNINLQNASIEEALSESLKGQGLGYKLVSQNIIITRIPGYDPTIAGTRKRNVQEIVITGRVTNEQGQPLEGVTVAVKGGKTVVTTTADGYYSVRLPNRDQSLLFSIIGYASQELPVSSDNVINVSLREQVSGLDEVIVVGYGTQRKANLTGAVDQIGPEVLEKRPITNVAQGLVGVVPNLNIQLLDGKPTQSPAFNVRGMTSVGQEGSALVLIDGVEGDPRMLNPNDIESISVLKDASSASIYGARAAFGVVLITTKKAVEGLTSITYSTNFSSRAPTAVPDNITDSYPWAQGFSDAWSRWNDNGNTPTAVNKTLPFSPAYLEEIKRRWEDPSLPRVEVDPATGEYQYYYSTDWYRELMKDRFFAQDHNLSLTGGNDKASFYVSGRFNGQDGLYRYNSDDYSMHNLRAKGTIQLTPWLQVENNAEYSKMRYFQPLNVGEGSGIWRNMADEGHPLAPLLNPDGSLSFSAAYTVGDYYIGRNGIDTEQRFLRNRTALRAEFFDKSLTVRGDFTFQNNDIGSSQKRVQVPYSRFEGVTGYTGTNTNDLEERRRTTEYLATNLYADYVKNFADAHHLTLLAGFNYEQSLYKNLTVRRNGIVYEDADDINLALGQGIVTTGGHQKWAIAGGFFRVNYNFKERYLLELVGRYDGSSKFPTDQQWAFFPSASVGWRLSEESFWNVNPAVLSNVKLRASYGSLGNGNINPYEFTENFRISQSGRIINGIRPQQTGQPGVIPAGLTWETVTTGNIGLDIGSLNNRLQFVGELYRRWTSDMFTAGPTLPAIYGTAVPRGNYADLETTGWEVTVNWQDRFEMAGKPFAYGIKVFMADSYATITKYNNQELSLALPHYTGQRIGEIWGYRVEGLFRSEEEIANSPSQHNIPNTNTRRNYPGDLKFVNLDGDDVIFHGENRVGNSGDKTIIGNSEPRYAYGINLSGDWNGFFLSAFFQGVLKQDWYPSAEARFWGQYNRPYNQYPRWHQDNMFREELGNFDAYLPRLVGYIAQGSGRALQVANDRFLQDASYIRLRNLQVGYAIPQRALSKLHAKGLTVYLSAENLWTWSPMYKWTRDTDVTSIYGSDRDLSGGNSGDGYNYPMMRSISAGLTLNF